MTRLTKTDIENWLTYWHHAKMVNFGAIIQPEHVAQARKFCSVMRLGVFMDVSDAAIWYAIRELRQRGRLPLYAEAV